jgi:hypothetical protein
MKTGALVIAGVMLAAGSAALAQSGGVMAV